MKKRTQRFRVVESNGLVGQGFQALETISAISVDRFMGKVIIN